MWLHNILPILIAWFCLVPVVAAQKTSPDTPASPSSSATEATEDFSQSVFPISSMKIRPSIRLNPSLNLNIRSKLMPGFKLEDDEGTGFCLDAVCRFVVTNYHIAVGARIRKINGVPIIQRYLATGAADQDITIVHTSSTTTLPFTWKRDLAIYELLRPLKHYHGLNFRLGELEQGEEVDVYGYSHELLRPIRSRKLLRFSCSFKGVTSLGLLAFDCLVPGNFRVIAPGSSGGIVVERKTKKIVGILTAGTDNMAMAVPVESLADFVKKVLPFEAKNIFPAVPETAPASVDIYPKFIPAPDINPKFVPVSAEGLQHRQEEPYEIRVLRRKAQEMADDTHDLKAVQSFAWGTGKSEQPLAIGRFEVRFVNGEETYREYPDGEKIFDQLPTPPLKSYIVPSGEWSTLPLMVGTELKLKITQDADVVVDKQKMKVFRYYAPLEDDLCPVIDISNYLVYKTKKTFHFACYGEVWVGEDGSIARITQNMDYVGGAKKYRGWTEFRTVITYDWLKLGDEHPRVVPKTIFSYSRYGQREIHWFRGSYADYQMFVVRSRIIRDSIRLAPEEP